MTYFRDNIEQMAAYTPGFQPKAVDVVKLNTNENPYPPSARVLEALQALTPETLRRYPDPTGQAFREAAARLHGMSYSVFISGLKKASVDLNRKMLAELAVNDTAAFTELAKMAKGA